MANEENLISLKDRPQRERNEIAKKGAEASNKKQAEQKTLRETMLAALHTPDEEGVTPLQRGVLATVSRWVETGDKAIMDSIRDLIGEKPKEEVNMDINDSESQRELREYLRKLKKGDENT